MTDIQLFCCTGLTQELRVGDTTLVVRRRSKTPQVFASIPRPVYITSEPLTVKDEAQGEAQKSRVGRKLEVGSDGIPVIHGVRVPDDENDKVRQLLQFYFDFPSSMIFFPFILQ